MDLLLASTSPIRRTLLTAAGVSHKAFAPQVGEAEIKRAHAGNDSDLAIALAAAKALSVSTTPDDAWVVGSDSLLSVDGRRFSKPVGLDEAADHLRLFSGRTLVLTSAAVLARAGVVDWSVAQSARLKVRDLSETFIQRYLDADWPEVSYCVGVFRLEGPGVQLFEKIEGDHFTILGLPLLPLLEALRQRGILTS